MMKWLFLLLQKTAWGGVQLWFYPYASFDSVRLDCRDRSLPMPGEQYIFGLLLLRQVEANDSTFPESFVVEIGRRQACGLG
jgi:hypothetical protein